MDSTADQNCRNCGNPAPSRFCPECGQSTSVSVPTLSALGHEIFASVLSYDSRLFNTIRMLVTRPGALTTAYLEGIRARYIPPFQLFVWLEALTFLVNRMSFDTDPTISNLKSRDLLIVGMGIAVLLCVLHALRRAKVITNVVFVAHLWSFLMLVLLFEYAALPVVGMAIRLVAPAVEFRIGIAATFIALAVMLIYAPFALMKVYGDKLWMAVLKTVAMAGVYVGLEILFQKFLHPGIQV